MNYQVCVYVYDKTISFSELLVYCVRVLRNHQQIKCTTDK